MAERRHRIICVLLCVCLCLLPCIAHAAWTTDAVEPVDPDAACSLTLSYRYGQAAFSEVEVRLYRIATVSAKAEYTLTEPFAGTELTINGIRTQAEWATVRSTLEASIVANRIEPTRTAKTDTAGQIVWNDLPTGLYFAAADPVVLQNGDTYFFDTALFALPGLQEDGVWQYQITAASKASALPPIDPDETTHYTVLKLWKGDHAQSRPTQVTVEIFRNGKSDRTVVLSAQNQWSYQWEAPADGSRWVVVERNIPSGYTVTVDTRATTFLLTNTKRPDTPPPGNDPPPPDTPTPDDPPSGGDNPPDTGDRANLLFYILLLCFSGSMLVILGILGKRSRA